MECRDLDKITTKKDIRKELVWQFQISDGNVSAINNLRKAYGGTQTEIVSLPLVGETLGSLTMRFILWSYSQILHEQAQKKQANNDTFREIVRNE